MTVVPEDLYIDEGQVLTSGGVSSGLDLCLHLIRRDHGPRLANQQARLLVAAPHRTGGQAPFIDLPVRAEPSDSPALYDWALRNLHQPLTVDQLAHQAGMSRRTLIRRFHTDTGQPPCDGCSTPGSPAHANSSKPATSQSKPSHDTAAWAPRPTSDPVQGTRRSTAAHLPRDIQLCGCEKPLTLCSW